MTSDDLIPRLVRDLRPVRPLPLPHVRLRRWALVTLAASALLVAAIGVRADIARAAASVPFHVHVTFIIIATLMAAASALALAVPGERMKGPRLWAPVVATAGWIGWLIAERAMTGGSATNLGWAIEVGLTCVAMILAMALLPGLSLAVLLARGLVVKGRAVFAFAALAATGAGALGAELACPKTSPTHLLVWHAGPVLSLTIIAALVGAPLSRIWMQRVIRQAYSRRA